MAKIRIPILIQDPYFWEKTGIDSQTFPPVDGADFERSLFEDGPKTDLVEVSDVVAAKYTKGKGKLGGYIDSSGKNLYRQINALMKTNDRQKIMDLINSDEFILVSTFACILRTVDLIEGKNVLGRPLAWQFSPERLVCQPRVEQVGLDARYERETRRIYFGFSSGALSSGRAVYVSLSRETVAHETAHAIVDGINPYLYGSLNPHARALHESLADLTSLLVTIRSRRLMQYVLGLSSGSLDGENAFSQFAENIGAAFSGGKKDALRSFVNEEKLGDSIKDVYRASTVLSGAIWDVIRKLHAPYRNKLAQEKFKDRPNPQYSASGEPLANLARRLRTLLYRALDYLPGGNISLADYGRALLLVDQIQFGPGTRIAENLETAFRHRNIFKSQFASQAGDDPLKYPRLPAAGWNAMLERENVLRDFIQDARTWIGIPEELHMAQLIIETHAHIQPPQNPGEFIEVAEFRSQPVGFLRILWNETVDNIAGGQLSKLASKRTKLIGTTIIVDGAANRILARLSNATPTPGLYSDSKLRADRASEIQAHDQETGRYLDGTKIKLDNASNKNESLVGGTARVVGDVITFAGYGLSLHGAESPVIQLARD